MSQGNDEMQQMGGPAESTWPTGERLGWVGADLSRRCIEHALTPDSVGLLTRRAQALLEGGRSVDTLRAEDLEVPGLAQTFADLARQLRWGPGLVLISGFPVGTASLEELRAMFWLVGAQFGDAVSQNIRGQRLGEVRVRDDGIQNRAYNRGGPLIFHCDRADMISLLCRTKAKSGGESLFVSSLAVRAIVARQRPELMPIFERGFFQHLGNEAPPGTPEITDHRLPVFGTSEGTMSCLFSGNTSLRMQRENLAELLSEEDEAALIYLRSVVELPELAFHLPLEEGDMIIVNNFEVLHSRADFQDDPERPRSLLRLWLQGRPARPLPESMHCQRNTAGRRGVDPLPLHVLAERGLA